MQSELLSFSTFNPTFIPWQYRALNKIHFADYDRGVQEFLLSGAIGSAKTTLAAHYVIRHCLENKRAKVLICRRTLPDLKETLFEAICSQLLNDHNLVEGVHYHIVTTRAHVTFLNGSKIISGYWADKRYKKFRSLELTGAVIEELTENDEQDKEAYLEIKNRIGRRKDVLHKFLISLTNPDSPEHWAYKYFIESPSEDRHVIYSKTEDNPFLPDSYKEQLKRDLDPRMARRMLYGEWLDIASEGIYYAYNQEIHFKKTNYQINKNIPLCLSFDFNIAAGKPMSVLLGQVEKNNDSLFFHCFDEVVIQTARTETVLEEIASRGYFDLGLQVNVYGDATGKALSTNSIHSNYDIIKLFLSNYKAAQSRPIRWVREVPESNPPIRLRHNLCNAYFENVKKENRVFVYEKCNTLNQGLRLTKLKKGAEYTEDDSKHFQHITTAFGYWVVREHKKINLKPLGAISR